MAWFEYCQNNSGGYFDINPDRGIGPRVWIEAPDAAAADSIAGSKGVYFDGCDDGLDCSCCGDRWYGAHGKGERKPEIDKDYDFDWHDKVYLHHADGRIEAVMHPLVEKS